MPRLMSFSMTTPQVRARTKTVTRRLGWRFLKPGVVLWAVEKAQGIPRGGKVVRICKIRVQTTGWEPLDDITAEDVEAEGFPGKSPGWFVAMFCKAARCPPDEPVNRIEFEYLDG